MPVHHVDMDVIGAGSGDRPDFLAQPGKVGGEDRRRDPELLLHRGLVTGMRRCCKAALPKLDARVTPEPTVPAI